MFLLSLFEEKFQVNELPILEKLPTHFPSLVGLLFVDSLSRINPSFGSEHSPLITASSASKE